MADEKQQGELTIAGMVEQFSGLAVKIFGFIAGAVGLLYGIGFAVVNISLLRYGVYEVSLVRARYVSAGVFYLVFFVLLVGGVRFSLFLAEQIVKGRPWASLALSVIPIGGVCCLLALGVWEFRGMLSRHFMIWCLGVSFFWLLFVRRDQIPWVRDLLSRADTSAVEVPSGAERKPAALAAWSLVAILLLVLLWVRDLLSRADTSAEGVPSGAEGKPAALAAWSLVGISLLVLLYYYGYSAYATFPAALGGGLPIVVQFSGEEKSMTALEGLGIAPEAPGLTRKVDLIAQTDTRYIVLVWDPVLKRDVAVSFEKSFSHGIRYYPEEYYLSDEYAAEKHTREGLAHLERNEPKAAVREFDEALRRVHGYTPALIGTGDAQLALKNYEEAIQSYEAVPEEDESIAVAQYGLARACTLSGQAEKAVDSLEKAIKVDETYQEKAKTETAFEAIKLHPKFIALIFQGTENAAIWYGQEGDGQREAENWDAAIVEYGRAISLTNELKDKTGEASYRYRRAGVYLDLDKHQDALNDYDEAVQLEPNNATYHLGLAEAYAAQQEFQSALDYYEKATGLSPDYIAAWIGKGDAYLALGGYEEASNSYTKAIAIDRNNNVAYYGRARAEALLGKSTEAIQDLRQAIILYPTYVEKAESEPDFDKIRGEMQPILSAAQHNRTGNSLENEGKLEEAIREYQEALKLDPTNAAYHANLGDVYHQLQRLGDAEEQYEKAVTHALENDSYRYRLAGVYYDQGKFDLAIEEYEAAVAINDENPVYRSGLGDAYRQKGSLDKAAGAYEQAIELDKSNASYHARLADIYQRQGNLENAVTKYNEAIRLDDENPAYHYGLAQVYHVQDKPQEAIPFYQAAIERNPDYGDAYCGLGLAYQESNQRQDAIEALRQCLEVSQDEELRKQASEALAELGEQ
ncbi:MAG: tetratricopeptide repeat protein [Anaerolineales bacterium]|nr:MAG: tetratricopeptide repeat protein [Anaerolineales bacterium]